MKLWTTALAKAAPALYATEKVPMDDKKIITKFFTPFSSFTWYVVEAEQQDGDTMFFGLVDSGHCKEWGYFSLAELESMNKTGNWRTKVERDLYWIERTVVEL